MKVPTFKSLVAHDAAGRIVATVRRLDARSVQAFADLGPACSARNRLVQWPDGVLSVVNGRTTPAAIAEAYMAGLVLREAYRVRLDIEGEAAVLAARSLLRGVAK